MLLPSDPVTNTSGLTLEQLSEFKKLEEITGTENLENSKKSLFEIKEDLISFF